MRALLVLALVACGDNLAEPDFVDDGFGQPCAAIVDGRLFTTCRSEAGLPGVCAVDVCRRWCTRDKQCPDDQKAIWGVANTCWCEP